jgi:hypothetical protein
MTPRGKIARLPRALRDKVNLRLQNGEEGRKIVAWLNSLPEVTHLLAAEFDGQPINEPNLSHWKAGGFREWENQQQALDAVRSFSAETAELRHAGASHLTDYIALNLAARLALALRQLPDDADPADLRQFCADLVSLRRGDHRAQWLRLEVETVNLEKRKFDHKLELEQKELKTGPVTKEALDQAAD